MYSKRVFFYLLGLLFFTNFVVAQSNEENDIKVVVQTFFEGLHAGDTLKIRKSTGSNVILQTIGKTDLGVSMLLLENFNDFLINIAAINHETTKIEEKLLSFDIKVDDDMANVWTPYEFYVNDEFSHCGVNSFQLFKEEGKWKIIYIIDTRRKENCNK